MVSGDKSCQDTKVYPRRAGGGGVLEERGQVEWVGGEEGGDQGRHQIRGRTLHLLLSFPVLTHQRYPTPPPLAPTLKRLLLSWTNS